jgi:3D (Asp-Asp-Asp) domain-containing protein
VVRGTRRWGLLLAAVLSSVVALLVGVVETGPAAGASGGSPSHAHAYRLRVDAVAYHLTGRTALGMPVRRGVVAVDPSLIPLGTRMHVPGYGQSVAADVGTAIKGPIIDLWMATDKAARKWGRHTVTITVYG